MDFFSLSLSIFINLLMFLPAFIFQTDKLTDISYSLSFVIVAGYLFLERLISWPKIIVLFLVFAWAFRLGAYLFIRINQLFKRDKRFDPFRKNFFRFLVFWLIQGISVWLVLTPTIFLLRQSEIMTFDIFSLTGVFIALSGLLLESIADQQKFVFLSDPRKKGQWLDEGLWRYTRHPNYLGEIMFWTGVYVFTLFYLPWTQAIIGVLSPFFITCLLMFATGVPKLEASAEAKWGQNPEYQAYKKRTGVLLPKINLFKKS